MSTHDIASLSAIAVTLLFGLLLLRYVSRVISWRITLPILAAVTTAVLLGVTPAQITEILSTLIGGSQ